MGSIPACAGEPQPSSMHGACFGVYPRVCGGTRPGSLGLPRWQGLSPRVRGNPAIVDVVEGPSGSIPACAGEPGEAAPGFRSWRVYPRVCGGTVLVVVAGGPYPGLSPRVRGNPNRRAPARESLGSIPACAGEPASLSNPTPNQRVYPRVCGGTNQEMRGAYPHGGLSPRVRGNPRRPRSHDHLHRSIPACAGEPRHCRRSRRPRRVYPRVCGGTRAPAAERCDGGGLSPRVRGNRQSSPPLLLENRSIPACAGEPRNSPSATSMGQVYPRVCGGTRRRQVCAASSRGLSPRVRGNRAFVLIAATAVRSIPACAGEPTMRRSGRRACGVYPRVCGGTQVDVGTGRHDEGLSPRVRGNLRPVVQHHRPVGSIPACAGEPGSSRCSRTASRVYPRVCGGTGVETSVGPEIAGLSPRVRGNRELESGLDFPLGSIPACAGEPRCCRHGRKPMRVYPRVCGGTSSPPVFMEDAAGLSPRVRGNREPAPHAPSAAGSIPACAGEPLARKSLILFDCKRTDTVRQQSVPYSFLTSSTPPASRISFGGSPR